jgi:transposase
MSTRFVNVDRRTPLLLPQDLREWVPCDDMVHFVLEAVEEMNMEGMSVNERGTGSEQYPPRMMLALLVYCYANGIFGSRRIERATYRDVAVRYLSGDTHPDHDTICKFRRENLVLVHECFVKVLELARELGLLKVGTVSVDGTKIRANASKHKSLRYDRAGELVEQLELEVKALLARAEQADNQETEDGQRLPEEIGRRQALKAKLEQARQRLEARAKARAKAEEEQYLRKLKAREGRQGSRKGPKPKAPSTVPAPQEQINLVDEDSRLMRKNKRSEYEQSYNAQAVVDAEGTQLVLTARVSQCASDRNELQPDVEQIPAQLGTPRAVLADSGYGCQEQVEGVQSDQTEVYVCMGSEAAEQHRRHDFRPRPEPDQQPKEPKAHWRKAMMEKLQTDTGRALYARRKQTVEPVFGIIKHAMGFRQFLLRGVEKVSGEWELVTLAYNMKRLWNLKLAAV